MKMSWVVTVAAVLGFAVAGAAGASTVSEATLGDFSGNFRTPSVITAGATTVEGTWAERGDYDLLAFTGLKSGSQTITLTFAPQNQIGERDYSFSAGGTVLYTTTPFQWSAWEGTNLANVSIQHWNRANTFTYMINLGDSFAGSLYLGLFGTYGTLKYSIDAPGNALAIVAPSASTPLVSTVPLPATAWMVLAALGGLMMAGRRRRAQM